VRINIYCCIFAGKRVFTSNKQLHFLLGVLTVLLHMQIAIALAHQAEALSLLALLIYFMHRLKALDAL
jgi:heme A synthase